MDTSRFTAQSPGSLTRIDTVWGPDFAFVPEPLPPNWAFPESMWPLLMEATNHLSKLEGFGRHLVDPGILLRPQRNREAIRSSEIEGTYANPKELLLFELDPKEGNERGDPYAETREIDNYRRALAHAESTEMPICLRLLRDLHRILMQGVRGDEKTPGEFRRVQVAIGKKGKFIPPPPGTLIDHLGPFESYLHTKQPKYHPLVDCFLAHYQFETIHPFTDGNGRVGRLLLSIMMQRSCKLTQPWLYMSEYFEQNRDAYYDGLYQVSANGSWASWIDYCLRGVCHQAERTATRFERLQQTRQELIDRIHAIGGSSRLVGIFENVFEAPLVRITAVRDRFKVSYNAAKSDIEKLVDAGVFKELSGVYPKTFYAPEVFAVAYDGFEDV